MMKETLEKFKKLKLDPGFSSLAVRNQVLKGLISEIHDKRREIISQNEIDVNSCSRGDAFTDRLRLTDNRIDSMIEGLKIITELPDPLGETTYEYSHPKGMNIRKVRVPIGNVALIYESRPNVTVDAAALAIKSGNNILLRGSSEAKNSNKILENLWHKALINAGLNQNKVLLCPGLDRSEITALCEAQGIIDLLIPRGGENLIKAVHDKAKVPVILHFKGNCHLYADKSADTSIAAKLIVDSKTNRMGVCNALESLLLHKANAKEILEKLSDKFIEKGITVYGCAESCSLLKELGISNHLANQSHFEEEFLGPFLSLKLVNNVKEATSHIGIYGSNHTEAIVSKDKESISFFEKNVDCSCLVVNASTRFNDGFELGLGAEMGISTSKLHAYGPMGLKELTCERFLIHGNGETKGEY